MDTLEEQSISACSGSKLTDNLVTGIELYLSPDYGVQDSSYIKVSLCFSEYLNL